MRNNTLVVWLWISNFYNQTQQTFAACYYAATQYGRKFPLNKKGYFGNLISLKIYDLEKDLIITGNRNTAAKKGNWDALDSDLRWKCLNVNIYSKSNHLGTLKLHKSNIWQRQSEHMVEYRIEYGQWQKVPYLNK